MSSNLRLTKDMYLFCFLDVESDVDSCNKKTRNAGDRANTLVDRMRTRTGESCVPYALKMAAHTGHGLWFVSWKNHRAYEKISKRKLCKWDCNWWSCSSKTINWSFDMILFG